MRRNYDELVKNKEKNNRLGWYKDYQLAWYELLKEPRKPQSKIPTEDDQPSAVAKWCRS